MASSLAAQLAQSASLNSAFLADRSRRKPTPSYLFSPREADQHDLSSIHSLATNAFLRLKSIEPALSVFDDALFSEAAKATDRTLQNAEANRRLDEALDSFLPLLGPYLLDSPTGKVIEWLVRRFRVHEFNVQAVLSLFLPYQESPHFAKMLSILHISESSSFAGLLSHKSTSAPLTHTALVSLMLKPNNDDLSRFVGSLLPDAVKTKSGAAIHRGLIAFHTGTLLDFVRASTQKSKGATDEGTLAWVLPAALEPLELCSSLEIEGSKESLITEVILSSYLLLSALSHTCPLTQKALASISRAVTSCAARVSTKQLVRTMASLYVPQELSVVSPLPKSVFKSLLKLPDVEEELQETLKYAGTEKFVIPFVHGLLARLDDERPFSIITSLVTYQKLPQVIVKDLTNALITLALGSDESDAGSFARGRSILVHIQQRHPEALQENFGHALNHAGDRREILEQLLISLSVNIPGISPSTLAPSDTDMVVASTSADASVRAIAVQKLYTQLSEGNVPATEMISVRSALLARVHDTHVTVLEALYSKPETLLSLITSDTKGFLQTLSDVLHSSASSPSRNLIRSHLLFVANHLFPRIVALDNAEELTAAVFRRIYFPYLLYSKSRQKTTSMAWHVIKESEGGASSLSHYELFRGCGEKTTSSEEDSLDVLAQVNVTVANKIAENMVSSPTFASHLAFIVGKIQDSNAHAKAFAHLIARGLLSQFSGARQIDVAHRLLDAMGLESLSGMEDPVRDAADLQSFLSSLESAVVHKPSKRGTVNRLQIAILALLPDVSRPATSSLDWISPSATEKDAVGSHFVNLMRKLYMLINSSSAIPIVSMHITQAQFIRLGEDVLKLLAGVWLQPPSSSTFHPAQYAALRHAAAFMEAHRSSQRCIDFQTILPAILVAMQFPDQRLREAALECVGALVRLAQAKKPIGVYAFDAVYGAASGELQYLDWADLSKYVNALYSLKEHLANDASYLRIFHQQHLLAVKTDSKKEASYKSRIICYLLSHVTSCTLLSAKVSLLTSVEDVSNSAKLQMLLPVIEKLASSDSAFETNGSEELYALLVACFDQTVVGALNDRAGQSWDVYLKVVRKYFRSAVAAGPRTVLARNLGKALFAKLRLDRKVDLCKVLLEQSQEDADISGECRVLLGSLVSEVDVIVDLLTALQPTVADAAQRATKRAKLDSGDNYALLSLLGEILGSKPLPGSLDLVSSLLETLSKVVHDTASSPADKTYTEQLLMSAVENAASNIPAGVSVSAASIRLDVLVELIRVSENPQTFNQALLLMATLTRLAPDAVVHNVMPVFTFMGSNVFHRDDTYSFRVVEKTIDAIVPVMVSSLKKSHSDRTQMHLASRSFLRIFTDAANHIPRHRRTAFFAHLVDVLGPTELLGPLCLLLVDKVSNKIVRQVATDSSNSLSLPLGTLHRYGIELQIATMVEMLHEAQRLLDVEFKLPNPSPTFLETSHDDERNAHSSAPKRQAHAILIFVAHALQQLANQTQKTPPGRETSSALLVALLDIAVSRKETLADASLSYISKIADEAVRDALAVMSAVDFVNGVLTAIETGEASILDGALSLLGEQLPNVAEKVRVDLRPAVLKIIEAVKKLIPTADAASPLPAAFHALSSIVSTVAPGEEQALTSTLSLIINSVRQQRATSVALETLLVLTNKLGPRTIPFFKDIVKECVGVLGGADLSASAEAIQVLQTLLASIPNFWSSAEIIRILNVYLECSVSAPSSITGQVWTFVKTLTKKVPSKVLVPTLCQYWGTLAPSAAVSAKHVSYFNVLKKSLHTAERSVVSEHLRSLFKIFLDAFGLCLDADYKAEAQSDIIATFLELVVKINEALFKPLFRKLFDWAFASDTDSARKAIFCDVYGALLGYFKALMTPYMSFLLQPFAELLTGFTKTVDDEDLWLAVVQTLTKSFANDEAAFWRDDRLRQLVGPIVAQVSVCTSLDSPDARDALSECVVALTEVITDDMLVKNVNLELLMHTRSEEARVRLYALTCAESLWRAHGAKLMGFAGETATFVAECAEDDNDSVVREAHRLKDAIESVAGRIDV